MDDVGGWAASAEAWIAAQGEGGDWARCHVLDAPMLARARGARRALDVGCGEGRFCRMLTAEGIAAVGVDPVEALIARARALDPAGDYRPGRAEALPFEDGAFDLVVSYLTLVDVPDLAAAIPEMARVLAPGGRLLIANLQSFRTADPAFGSGERPARVARYLEERPVTLAWDGLRVTNLHRPLSAYIGALIGAGLGLTAFEEPRASGGDPDQAARHADAPAFLVMEWARC